MELRQLGRTGMRVSPLGFGAAEIGFENAEQEVVNRLLGSAIDAGLNVVDTAECYADSEAKLGTALRGRRDEVFLFTKCGHASGFDLPDWDPELLRRSIDRSLELLKTDRLDLVQLHSCDLDTLRRGDAIQVLKLAREAGKTRFIGFSGDREAAAYAVECGEFDTLQTSVNIADQQILDSTLPAAKAAGMGVIAKRPVANVAWRTEPPVGHYNRPYWDRLQALAYPLLGLPLGEAVGQALRFTLTQYVQVAIVGTTKPDRWAQNAAYAGMGPLPADEAQAIRARWREVAGPDWEGMT